jgi:hypothetical protein
MAIDVVILIVPMGCLYPNFYIQGGVVTRKVTDSVAT